MLISISLIAFHRHDHLETHSLSAHGTCHSTDHDNQHHNSDDCQYCFLYYQQSIQLVSEFQWDASPVEYDLMNIIVGEILDSPFLKRQYSKGLRAPPIQTTNDIA